MMTRLEGPSGLDTSALHTFHAMARNNIMRALQLIRKHLDMDVAFISEFLGDWRYMHYVDARRERAPIAEGDQILLQDGYCQKIVEGQLPELIVDTAEIPEAMAMPDTHEIPIGSHISVPLRLADGKLFGTFCCFSFKARTDLRERDLESLRKVANEVAKQIDDHNYELPLSEIETILRRDKEF